MSKNTISAPSVEFRVSENTFVKDMIAGIERACEVLKRYSPWLDWEDIKQEAFEKAWRHRDTYDSSRASVRTWTNRIVLNCRSDAQKRFAKQVYFFEPLIVEDREGDEYDITDNLDYVDLYEGADSLVLRDEVLSAIDDAIDTLPIRQQQVLRLSLDGMPPREIAKDVGYSSSVVSSLLCRAKAAVRRLLSEMNIAA